MHMTFSAPVAVRCAERSRHGGVVILETPSEPLEGWKWACFCLRDPHVESTGVPRSNHVGKGCCEGNQGSQFGILA
jgi:hypothetical protein